MQIAAIETWVVRIPIKPEYTMITALGVHDVSDYVVLRVLTDDGQEGVGEATVSPRWSGETVWGTQALIERIFAPALIGVDPTDIAEINRRMDERARHNWFAKSAIEMACWDLAGKQAGKPVHALLGGNCRPLQFACRFSMGAYETDHARRRAQELIDAGFETIKVKVGGEAQQDIERVRAVREVIEMILKAKNRWQDLLRNY